MTEDGLQKYQAYIGKECLYIERPIIMTTKVLAVEIKDKNIEVTLLTTHAKTFRYQFFRNKDEGLTGEWLASRHLPDKEWTISMPGDHAYIENQYKLYFGSTFGMGMRLYFIPEFVALFKRGDLSWWDELEKYNRPQPM